MRVYQRRTNIETLVELVLKVNDANYLQQRIQEHKTLYEQQTNQSKENPSTLNAEQQIKARILVNVYKAAQAKPVGDEEAYHAHIKKALKR